MFRRKLKDTVFRADIYLVVCPIEELRRWCNTRWPEKYDRSDMHWQSSLGKCIEIEHNQLGFSEFIVWLPATIRTQSTLCVLETLMHECMHLTLAIMRYRRVIISPDSEEAVVSYAGSMFRQAVEAMTLDALRVRAQKKTKRRKVR
jgi:hypothetical protein